MRVKNSVYLFQDKTGSCQSCQSCSKFCVDSFLSTFSEPDGVQGRCEKKWRRKGELATSGRMSCLELCDPCRIQTCNLLIRSQILYSVELMGPRVRHSRTQTKSFVFAPDLLKSSRPPLSPCETTFLWGPHWGDFSKAGAKVLLFFDLTKYFGKKIAFNSKKVHW